MSPIMRDYYYHHQVRMLKILYNFFNEIQKMFKKRIRLYTLEMVKYGGEGSKHVMKTIDFL